MNLFPWGGSIRVVREDELQTTLSSPPSQRAETSAIFRSRYASMLRRSRSQQADSERDCAHQGVVQDQLDEEIASGGAHRRLNLSSLPHHDVLPHIEDLDEQNGVRGLRAAVATSTPSAAISRIPNGFPGSLST